MKTLGKKWVSADKVRVVKLNGRKVVEIKRIVKSKKPVRTRRNTSVYHNGYMVWPDGSSHMKLSAANKKAKADSKRDGSARVESVNTQKTLSRWVDGRRVK